MLTDQEIESLMDFLSPLVSETESWFEFDFGGRNKILVELLSDDRRIRVHSRKGTYIDLMSWLKYQSGFKGDLDRVLQSPEIMTRLDDNNDKRSQIYKYIKKHDEGYYRVQQMNGAETTFRIWYMSNDPIEKYVYEPDVGVSGNGKELRELDAVFYDNIRRIGYLGEEVET